MAITHKQKRKSKKRKAVCLMTNDDASTLKVSLHSSKFEKKKNREKP